ncbi:hypothetical protein THAOC_17281, partial [Thalassiosira oceanica]
LLAQPREAPVQDRVGQRRLALGGQVEEPFRLGEDVVEQGPGDGVAGQVEEAHVRAALGEDRGDLAPRRPREVDCRDHPKPAGQTRRGPRGRTGRTLWPLWPLSTLMCFCFLFLCWGNWAPPGDYFEGSGGPRPAHGRHKPRTDFQRGVRGGKVRPYGRLPSPATLETMRSFLVLILALLAWLGSSRPVVRHIRSTQEIRGRGATPRREGTSSSSHPVAMASLCFVVLTIILPFLTGDETDPLASVRSTDPKTKQPGTTKNTDVNNNDRLSAARVRPSHEEAHHPDRPARHRRLLLGRVRSVPDDRPDLQEACEGDREQGG